MPLTPGERALRARIAAYASWANTPDRAARTKPGRDASMARFEREVDPEGVLSPAERRIRAASARKAHFSRLAYRSARARRRKAGDGSA